MFDRLVAAWNIGGEANAIAGLLAIAADAHGKHRQVLICDAKLPEAAE
jgi:hypothetical protein